MFFQDFENINNIIVAQAIYIKLCCFFSKGLLMHRLILRSHILPLGLPFSMLQILDTSAVFLGEILFVELSSIVW